MSEAAPAAADMSDDDLLAILKDERAASIGFDHDTELNAQREQALNYAKGVMPDVPVMENRSKATSSDVADAIETAAIQAFIGTTP